MKVSVIIANYNYDRYLSTAIYSVLAQTYTDYEIIVVDDGSTDNSHQLLAEFHSKLPADKFKVILQENQGHGGAINTGFQNSVGEILAFLDSDDIWHPSKLEQIVRAFKQPGTAGVAHMLDVIDSGGIAVNLQTPFLQIPDDNLARIILDTGGIWHFPATTGLSFHRSVLQKILPITPPEWRFWPDGCLLYCAAFLGKITAINEVLGSYRTHEANTFWSAEKLTPERKAKAIAGVEMTNQWLNQFLERIGHPNRVNLSKHLDHRRAKYYLQGKWNLSEMREISQLILTWHFYSWHEKLNYLMRFWVKSTGFLIYPATVLEKTTL
ncbi:glycosyltransferase family 2 protein [Phormidesmis sp. 146-35]